MRTARAEEHRAPASLRSALDVDLVGRCQSKASRMGPTLPRSHLRGLMELHFLTIPVPFIVSLLCALIFTRRGYFSAAAKAVKWRGMAEWGTAPFPVHSQPGRPPSILGIHGFRSLS
ncbi:hypothetical protein N658DRAFT_461999 [Parathielavia hyrcaniae]|uniref:Uncharacterized protein n=1 Tax=Parathielavia hyrcaniae TaxID=113614 RepID=A0AAN6QEV8_9PEZI|nr:hypothetical protein N658DRAFT_461999 [Parathielavia hyrcaniae]